MWKLLGIFLTLGGVGGILYSWVMEQKDRQMRVDVFLLFLQKSLSVMKSEKIIVATYFQRVIEQDMFFQNPKNEILHRTLEEIIRRLSLHTYPSGQMVWEEVLREKEQDWNLDKETFETLVQAGNGFFGRSREENIRFLNKSIEDLEQHQVRLKEKSVQERKVWIPVGMLGSIMLVILFL